MCTCMLLAENVSCGVKVCRASKRTVEVTRTCTTPRLYHNVVMQAVMDLRQLVWSATAAEKVQSNYVSFVY